MNTEVIYDDNHKPLGIVIQSNEPEENKVLARCLKDGMMPISFNASDGLLITFGKPVIKPAAEETDAAEVMTEPNPYAG